MEILVKTKGFNPYADAQHERSPHGVIVIDGQEVASTLQCPHCGQHFVSSKGSGATRSFCMVCKGVTCGGQDCLNHETWQAKLERMERGR